MTQITIRGVDQTLHIRLRQKAKEKNMSMNRYILLLLQEEIGGGAPIERKFDDLDHLFGTWDEAAYAEFQTFLEGTREIDRDLWS